MPKRGTVVRKNAGKRCSSTTAILCLGAMLLFCMLAATPSSADDNHRGDRRSRLSSDLDGIAAESAVEVIVQFRDVSEQKHFKKVRGLGARQKAVLHLIDADSFTVPAASLSQLADDPDIKYVSPDRTLTASFDREPSADFVSIAWSFGWTGEGIGVAVLDSGVNPHPDLAEFGSTASRIVYNESFVEGEPSAADEFGHGTYIAGLIAGNGQSSSSPRYRTAYRGIAERAAIINLRILDKNGVGRDSAAIAAIERAIELKDIYNIRIINLSIGRPVFESYKSDPLCQAVEAAWRAGIVVVVAAGNFGRNFVPGTEGYGSITAPGNHPFAITVGAADTQGSRRLTDDTVARFSSKGPTLVDHIAKPDLVAPGTRSHGGNGDDDDRTRRGGTSTSAAVVSGALALMLQQNPQLTPDQLKARLMKSAFKEASRRQSGRRHDAFGTGAGFLDIEAALAEREWAPPEAGTAKSLEVAYDKNRGSVYFVQDDSLLWNSSSAWAIAEVWGNAVVSADSGAGVALRGNSVVWGPTQSAGFKFIWSDSLPSGTTALNPHDGGAPLPTCYPRKCGR